MFSDCMEYIPFYLKEGMKQGRSKGTEMSRMKGSQVDETDKHAGAVEMEK